MPINDLNKIFKVNENLTDEQKYDRIMHEAMKVYEYQKTKHDNPYSFHVAFEYVLRKIKENKLEDMIL